MDFHWKKNSQLRSRSLDSRQLASQASFRLIPVNTDGGVMSYAFSPRSRYRHSFWSTAPFLPANRRLAHVHVYTPTVQLRWQIRRGAHFQRILISATARTLSLRRLRDSARGLSKEYPARSVARRPAGSRARAGGAVRSPARARAAQYSGFPHRYTVIRCRIGIGSTASYS